MVAEITVEYGEAEEREYFTQKYQRFFGRLPNLRKALNKAFMKMNALMTRQDIEIATLGKLSVDDFNVILLLCGNGFGNAAMQIVRSTYEKIVTARYLHLHPEMADAFWEFHAVKLSKLGLDEIRKKIDPNNKISEEYKGTRKHSNRRRNELSWLGWSDLSFEQMANEVGMGDHLKNAYYLPSEYVHPSMTLVLSLLRDVDGKLTIMENEPQRETADIAFPIAYYLLLEVLRLQIDHFKLDDPIFQKSVDDYVYVMWWDRKDMQDSSGWVRKIRGRKSTKQRD